MKHGDEAYRVFRELLQARRRINHMFGMIKSIRCLESDLEALHKAHNDACDENRKLWEENRELKEKIAALLRAPKETTEPANCGSVPFVSANKEEVFYGAPRGYGMKEALKKIADYTHSTIENETSTEKQYGEWWSFKESEPETLHYAINHITKYLVDLVAKNGVPDEIEWIIRLASTDNILDPIDKPNREIYPYHDSTIGWKVCYNKARPAGQ